MFDKDDIQVDGSTVMAKQWTSETHYNWVCIARFHHNTGVNIDPRKMAEKFARSIIR